jgi:hypothetical protein
MSRKNSGNRRSLPPIRSNSDSGNTHGKHTRKLSPIIEEEEANISLSLLKDKIKKLDEFSVDHKDKIKKNSLPPISDINSKIYELDYKINTLRNIVLKNNICCIKNTEMLIKLNSTRKKGGKKTKRKKCKLNRFSVTKFMRKTRNF